MNQTLLGALALIALTPSAGADAPPVDPRELLPGGATTHHKGVNRNAFSHPSANMSFERELDFKVGNGFFKRVWVSAPSSTTAADGLGPLYNARSCQRCHLKDGRGHPPTHPADNAVSMFLRLSIPPQDAADRERLASRRASVVPEPTYGTQLQDFAIQGHQAEGRMVIEYAEVAVDLAGGEEVTLRRPTYRVTELGHGPMHPEALISPRVAPQMIGLGLLEAIPEADILAWADPEDRDGDGISGRPNRVWSPLLGRVALGRFGWKAGTASVDEQSQDAFAGDMGISTPLHPAGHGECTPFQVSCRKAADGNSPEHGDLEASQKVTDLVAFYARNLAVPARREPDHPDVLAGRQLFYQIGCHGCHRPSFTTSDQHPHREQAGQTLWPYTDLLLHDLGEGLADGRPEGDANGREWRTAPLWGIGLTPVVNGHSQYLHDGRARNLLEAILWHGGEAQAQRDAVARLPRAQRDQLLKFLGSL